MADEEKKPSYGDPEYYNLNINWDIKDAPEVKAVINMLFEMKEKGNNKPFLLSGKNGTTYKDMKTGDETNKNICVHLNKSKSGDGFYATVKIESETSDSPFDDAGDI